MLLPALCAVFFYLATLALPTGFDLSGVGIQVFYFFILAPLTISGAGQPCSTRR